MARSSTLEKEARRRLSFVTPENAAKVLSKDIYWTVPFLQVYLDRCEEIGAEEPKRALLMTTHAPGLAQRIGVGERAGEYANDRSKNSHLVLAHSMLGSINRRCGHFSVARGCYAHASELMKSDSVSDYARADYLRRFAKVQSATDEVSALDTFNEAASVFMRIGHGNGLALTLIARATLYCRQNEWCASVADLRRAFVAADETTVMGKKAVQAAVINLCFAVANGGVPLGEQSNILKSISSLRSRLGQQRFSNTKAKLYWMEGLLHQNLGFTRQAERVLERSRQGFIKLGDPYEFTLVSVDLAQVLLIDGETEKIEQLQKSTIAALSEMTTPDDLEEAMTQWRRRPHSEETLNALREQVRGLNGRQCKA